MNIKAKKDLFGRRNFLKKSTLLTFGTGGLLTLPQSNKAGSLNDKEDIFLIGPIDGFTPQIGTLVSMMNWIHWYKQTITGLSAEEMDYLYDSNANSIGTLILHMIDVELWAQDRTFGSSMKLKNVDIISIRDKASKKEKGKDSKHYLKLINDVREYTLKEFSKRDDNWLTEIDKDHPWPTPINNYGQWFHVFEHESNHIGQINFLKSRLPSTKKND